MWFLESPGSSAGKESTCNAGDPSLIPGWERSPGEGIGYPLQYSWTFLVAQLVKNQTAMQETWVRSLGWEDPWRRERLPTTVFWLGEFHGLYSPWGRKESDTTERLSLYFRHQEWNFVKTLRKKNMDIKILLSLSIHYLITKNFLILNTWTKEG